MGERRLRGDETDSDGAVATAENNNTIFIDTSLDTHLAMIVSDSDTASDLKRKIFLEHPRSFPEIGKIKVDSIKVKRKGHFYHLSDSMRIKSAFEEAKKSWFLSVDASTLKSQTENKPSCEPNAGNQLALLCITNHPSYDCSNAISGAKGAVVTTNREDAIVEQEKSKKRIVDVQCNNSIEEASYSGPAAKKKRRRVNEGSGNPLEENKVLVINSDTVTSKLDIVTENSVDGKRKSRYAVSNSLFTEPQHDDSLRTGGKRKRQEHTSSSPLEKVLSIAPAVQDVGEEGSFKEIAEITNRNVSKGSAKAIVAGHGPQPETLSEPSSIPSQEKLHELVDEVTKVSNLPHSSTGINSKPDAGHLNLKDDAPEVAAGSGVKRTKRSKKSHTSDLKETPAPVIKETQNVNNDVMSSMHKNTGHDGHKSEADQLDKIGEEREASVYHDLGGLHSKSFEPVNHDETDVPVREPAVSANILNVEQEMGSEKTPCRKRKKKMAKKSASKIPDVSDVEQGSDATHGISSIVLQSGFDCHMGDKSKKIHVERKEISEQKPLDASPVGADGEGDNGSRDKGELVPLTETNKNLSLNHDSSVILCESRFPGDLDVNIKEPILSSELHVGSKRKKKRAKKSSARGKDLSNMSRADTSVSGNSPAVPNSSFKGQFSETTTKDGSILSLAEEKEVSKENSIDTSLINADRVSEVKLSSLTRTNRGQEDAENVVEKSRNKVRKSRNSAAKSLSNSPIKKQGDEVESLQLNQADENQGTEDVHEKSKKKTGKNQKLTDKNSLDLPKGKEVELPASNDKARDVNTTPKTAKKSSSIRTSTLDQITGSELELEKDTGSKSGSLHPSLISAHGHSYQVSSSHTREDISKVTPEPKIDSAKHENASKCGEDQINFEHYFLRVKNQKEVADAAGGIESTRSERRMKGKTNAKNLVLASPDIDQITPAEPRRPDVVCGSGTDQLTAAHANGKRKSVAESRSSSSSESAVKSLKNSRKRKTSPNRSNVAVKKASNLNTGEVVNSSRQNEKSLLTTPGGIFKDSSESSDNENGSENSDASTRTPSDKSSSSGISEGSIDSTTNGSKREEAGGKNIKNSHSPGPRDMTMDKILRSSSRFKKAKFTASQLEDTEDFVPESEPN